MMLIYSQSKEENLAHLRQVFLTLREAKLYVNLKKCSFIQPHVLFLGIIVFDMPFQLIPKRLELLGSGLNHNLSLRLIVFMV